MTMIRASRSLFLIILSLMSTKIVNGNDECDDATVVTQFPFLDTTGDTTGATVDFSNPTDNFRNLTCGIKPDARGVWYRIDIDDNREKEGSFVQAKVIDSPGGEAAPTDFNTALFRGSSCDELECMLYSEYQFENQKTEPTSTWFAAEGESYYLHVTGFNENDVGSFILSIEELDVSSPDNDMCPDAEELTIMSAPILISGDSSHSRPHGLTNVDCSMIPSSRGLFYSVEGTGGDLNVTLTKIITEDIRLELAVLSDNNCEKCVMFSDFLTSEDPPHSLVFGTNAGASYVVVVSGQGFQDVGEFEIQVEEVVATSSSAVHPRQITVFLSFFGFFTALFYF